MGHGIWLSIKPCLRSLPILEKTILRLYQWSQPTVSLGYFQSFDERRTFPSLANARWVRRVTGGGAILHDREITYSIAVPSMQSTKGPANELYESVHRSIVNWLHRIGIPAHLHRDPEPAGVSIPPGATRSNFNSSSTQNQPAPQADNCRRQECESFLCFERRSAVDVVVSGSKILGSAQRRSKWGLLQHGSFLISSCPLMPSLRGIDQICPERIRETDAQWLTDFQIAVRTGIEDVFPVVFAEEKPKFPR